MHYVIENELNVCWDTAGLYYMGTIINSYCRYEGLLFVCAKSKDCYTSEYFSLCSMDVISQRKPTTLKKTFYEWDYLWSMYAYNK